MTGTVGILNVGAGDTKLSFDPKNPAERIRAARIVKDMLRRGYAMLVEVECNGVKKFERALEFKDDVCEYVIADFDPVSAQEADEHEQEQTEAQRTTQAKPAKPKAKHGRKSVSADKTRAVAVAPIAGG